MTDNQALAWMFAEDSVTESPTLLRARSQADEFGIPAITAAAGAFLRMLVRLTGATQIVEVGTGTGISGLYLLGSGPVTLTSIDTEREAQHAARSAFASSGVRESRMRLIPGRSADLLPRLAQRSYDMVVLDGDPLEAAGDVQEALRLLKPGGVIVLLRALMGGLVADPARREDDVVAMRSLVRALLESDEVDATLVPVGDGVLVARVAG